MNYDFPEIRTIDDVLPHVQGREEFIVAERDFGTVINYAVSMADTFNMTGSDDLGGAIRRECRGLIFDKSGKLVSRPFHKFFNINERDETQSHVVALHMLFDHVIMEKMDGSMIRPLMHEGRLRLGTKMGITDVSNHAETWLSMLNGSPAEWDMAQLGLHVDPHNDWLRLQITNEVTPLFEWTSPMNQIVLAYEKEDLVYLGSRHNITGEYFFDESAPFTHVPRYGRVKGNLDEYIARQRGAENREGDIIRFADGHMLKLKNDWYVRIHKTIDRIVFDRNIVNLIINEEVDDVVPMLPQMQIDRVREFESRFWRAFQQKENRLRGLRMACHQSYDDDRKQIAIHFVPSLENRADAQFIFCMLDGHDIRELMLQYVEKNINSNVKWDACAEWLGMV